MHIETVKISGFRCFDPNPATIHFRCGLAGGIGANEPGKTAVLQALMRLFVVNRAQRTIVPSVFHVAPTEAERAKSRRLTIEVPLSMAELVDGSATAATIAPVIRPQEG